MRGANHCAWRWFSTRSFTWIDEVIDGAYKAGQIDGCNGMSFNLGRPEEVSILDLANRIASLTKTSVTMERAIRVIHSTLTRCGFMPKPCWEASTSLDEGSNLCLTLFNNMMPFRRSRGNSVHPVLAKYLNPSRGFVECTIN